MKRMNGLVAGALGLVAFVGVGSGAATATPTAATTTSVSGTTPSSSATSSVVAPSSTRSTEVESPPPASAPSARETASAETTSSTGSTTTGTSRTLPVPNAGVASGDFRTTRSRAPRGTTVTSSTVAEAADTGDPEAGRDLGPLLVVVAVTLGLAVVGGAGLLLLLRADR